MKKVVTNIQASIRDRLRNKAKETNRSFAEILQYLKGYPPESVISEKFEAMIKLGLLNSRMKDFYDIWLMMHQFDFLII